MTLIRNQYGQQILLQEILIRSEIKMIKMTLTNDTYLEFARYDFVSRVNRIMRNFQVVLMKIKIQY